jgi:hypothetical protein
MPKLHLKTPTIPSGGGHRARAQLCPHQPCPAWRSGTSRNCRYSHPRQVLVVAGSVLGDRSHSGMYVWHNQAALWHTLGAHHRWGCHNPNWVAGRLGRGWDSQTWCCDIRKCALLLGRGLAVWQLAVSCCFQTALHLRSCLPDRWVWRVGNIPTQTRGAVPMLNAMPGIIYITNTTTTTNHRNRRTNFHNGT